VAGGQNRTGRIPAWPLATGPPAGRPGLTREAAARILGISARTADRYWAYARAWLRGKMESAGPNGKMEETPDAGDAVSSH
jgi:hypothetical protein